jgi:hypothetical protein
MARCARRPRRHSRVELTLCSAPRKEVAFGDDGKVLLARLGDKIHATSAFCAPRACPRTSLST